MTAAKSMLELNGTSRGTSPEARTSDKTRSQQIPTGPTAYSDRLTAQPMQDLQTSATNHANEDTSIPGQRPHAKSPKKRQKLVSTKVQEAKLRQHNSASQAQEAQLRKYS